MPVRILILECSSSRCSVALSEDGVTKGVAMSTSDNSHAEVVTLLIRQLLIQCGITLDMLHAICHSNGPGSYTGLRVGASTAKGLAYGLQIPVICISTLKGLAAGALSAYPSIPKEDLICPMIDARRMEVYTQLFSADLNEVSTPQAKILTSPQVFSESEAGQVWYCGDGMPKAKELLSQNPQAKFMDDIKAQAENFSKIAFEAFLANQFADTAYFEPFYLKDYEAKLPGKLL